MKKYYIYHIEGIKIGCTTNVRRRINQQKFDNYEILETHTDIDIASKREIELQKEYGYKTDTTIYKQTFDWGKSGRIAHTQKSYQKWFDGSVKWRNENPELVKKYATMGGKVVGKELAKRNVESGHISNLGKQNAEINNRIQTCPHCKIVSRGIGYIRWHGNNCKHKIVK